ncbi:unnamed protein product [Boreogadus saida]
MQRGLYSVLLLRYFARSSQDAIFPPPLPGCPIHTQKQEGKQGTSARWLFSTQTTLSSCVQSSVQYKMVQRLIMGYSQDQPTAAVDASPLQHRASQLADGAIDQERRTCLFVHFGNIGLYGVFTVFIASE